MNEHDLEDTLTRNQALRFHKIFDILLTMAIIVAFILVVYYGATRKFKTRLCTVEPFSRKGC
jgi:flagellar biogenesis protein FliO